MAKRIPVSVLLAPIDRFRHAVFVAEGFAPSIGSRFAVVRRKADAPWILVHRRSGAQVTSLLPPRKVTMTDMLRVTAAWDAATHLNWAPFDALPETTPETKEPPGFADRDAAGRTATEMRALVSQVLGV